MLLSVENLHVYYGAIHAVKDVSLHVQEGEIVTRIGANGAGVRPVFWHIISVMVSVTIFCLILLLLWVSSVLLTSHMTVG